MAISREKKEELVAEYIEQFNNSEAIIVTSYRGLTVTQLQQLRAKIREANGGFTIVKNTLAQRALGEAGLSLTDDMLAGPVALGFCYETIPPVAKAITDFAKVEERLMVKGGLIGKALISEADIRNLANLPPLDVLRAQLLGLLNAPATQLASVLASSVRQLVNVCNAYAEKESEAAPAEG